MKRSTFIKRRLYGLEMIRKCPTKECPNYITYSQGCQTVWESYRIGCVYNAPCRSCRNKLAVGRPIRHGSISKTLGSRKYSK